MSFYPFFWVKMSLLVAEKHCQNRTKAVLKERRFSANGRRCQCERGLNVFFTEMLPFINICPNVM